MPRTSLTALALAALTLAPACQSDEPGSLLLTFRLGNDKSCAETGVQEIQVVLDEENGIEGAAPCADGQIEILGLPVGGYNVDVTGTDANGVVIMDNVADGRTKINISGSGKQVMPNQVALTDAPAKLELLWDFGPSSCDNVGITEFELEAFDESGSSELMSAVLDCTAAPDTPDGYRFVPDPERGLDGRRFGEVGVQALDSSGAAVGGRVVFTLAPPTPGYTVKISLDCGDTGCSSATNMPD